MVVPHPSAASAHEGRDSIRTAPATGVSAEDTGQRLRRLSVVIANHDYAQFVARSVESALAIEWPDVEVVVVDDGSTDDSLTVLEPYRARVRLIRSDNRGQREAANLGYAHTTGEVVIFLDSDDVLPPDVARAIDRVLAPGVSKVQFKMQRIDEHDVPIGLPFPRYDRVPTAGRIRAWMAETTAYPTPPASGNAYSRGFLRRVMPLGPQIGAFADSGLLAAAPLLGDVVVVPEVTVGYRRHGANDSDLLQGASTFHRECDRALRRWNYAREVARLPPDPERVFRSREVLQFRVAAARRTPELRLPGDNRRRMLRDAAATLAVPGPERAAKRIAIAAWSIAVLLLPARTAHVLIDARFR